MKYIKIVGGAFKDKERHYAVKRRGVPTKEMLQGNVLFVHPVVVNIGPFSGTFHEVIGAYPLHSN